MLLRAWQCAAVALVALAYDARVEIVNPREGATTLPNLDVQCDLWVDKPRLFSAKHGESGQLCLRVSPGAEVACTRIATASLPLRGLAIGHHTLEAWLVDAGGQQLSERHTISFTVATQVAAMKTEDHLDGPDLLQWFAERQRTGLGGGAVSSEPSFKTWRQQLQAPLLLAICIKSSTSK